MTELEAWKKQFERDGEIVHDGDPGALVLSYMASREAWKVLLTDPDFLQVSRKLRWEN